MKAQVLYDFDGQTNTSELSVRTGDILTVTRQDIGEGWWEGIDEQGRTGIFPAAYVEVVETFDSDDDWDDDSDSGTTVSMPTLVAAPNYFEQPVSSSISSVRQDTSTSNNKMLPVIRGRPINKNQKSASDCFITGTLQIPVDEKDKCYIIDSEYGIIWHIGSEPYTCAVASPKKESKLKGFKTFIVYQLTPSFNNIQVSRRYKHFDWLHGRLEDKFSLIPIPPLPDKQISGRYEEHFIERRKNQLQVFIDWVCRHPVLNRCEVLKHFLTCTDEKKWKAGKRRAEKDELVGPNYFFAIEAPESLLSLGKTEQETESFARYVHGLDISVKNLSNLVWDQAKKWQITYKRDYQRIGHAFATFGQSFGMEEQIGYSRNNLVEAIKSTGNAYNDIGKLFEEQPKLDWEPFGDMLHVYKGIIGAYPEILAIHKGALQKRRECEKLAAEGKVDGNQLQIATRRADVVSYTLLAEINHFHAEQIAEINRVFKTFLTKQIEFHQNVTANLQNVLKLFE